MKRYLSVLLAAVLFVLGMLGGGTADAAKITADDVSRTVTIQPRAKKGEEKPSKTVQIKMHVMLENLDLKAYEKYTAELRKNAKYGNVVFAKAAPGSKVTITADAAPIPGILSKPARDYNYSVGIKYYNHKKIGTLKELTSLGKEDGFVRNYTIPNDVEEVTAVIDLTYHVGMEVGKEMKSSIGTYRQEPRLFRYYYIFTSDAACKKAFELMTASSVTGAISNVFGGDKKPNAKSDSKDSGGMEMVIGVVIGVAVLGAVGYGAYRMFGKGGGSKGNGAGNYNNPASAPQPDEQGRGQDDCGISSFRADPVKLPDQQQFRRRSKDQDRFFLTRADCFFPAYEDQPAQKDHGYDEKRGGPVDVAGYPRIPETAQVGCEGINQCIAADRQHIDRQQFPDGFLMGKCQCRNGDPPETFAGLRYAPAGNMHDELSQQDQTEPHNGNNDIFRGPPFFRTETQDRSREKT